MIRELSTFYDILVILRLSYEATTAAAEEQQE